MHFLLTTDLSPIVIREYLDNPRVLRDISAKMDSIISVQLPASVWTEEQPKNPRDDRWKLEIDSTAEPREQEFARSFEKLKRRAYAVARSCMVHKTHAATCRKGDVGKYKCRMAYPRGCFNGDTTLLQIALVYDPSSEKMVPKALVEIDAEKMNSDQLLKWKDDRIIILELQRPGRDPDEASCMQEIGEDKTLYWADVAQSENECVVSFSPSLSAALGCNANAESLGNLAQAKAATFCLMPLNVFLF